MTQHWAVLCAPFQGRVGHLLQDRGLRLAKDRVSSKAGPRRPGMRSTGTATKEGPCSLFWAPVPSYLPWLWAGAPGCPPISTLGWCPLEYSQPARGMLGPRRRPLAQGCLAGPGLGGSSQSGARSGGQRTGRTCSRHSPRAGWGLSGAALQPGPKLLRARPGAATGWHCLGHCWWWTRRSSPVAKGGRGRQSLAPAPALPLLPVASPASRTPAGKDRGTQGKWPGCGSPLPE